MFPTTCIYAWRLFWGNLRCLETIQERKFHDWATFPGGRTKTKTQNAKNKEIRENWNFKLNSIVIAGEFYIQFHMREEQKSPLDTAMISYMKVNKTEMIFGDIHTQIGAIFLGIGEETWMSGTLWLQDRLWARRVQRISNKHKKKYPRSRSRDFVCLSARSDPFHVTFWSLFVAISSLSHFQHTHWSINLLFRISRHRFYIHFTALIPTLSTILSAFCRTNC